MKKLNLFVLLALTLGLVLTGCAAPTPEVVEKEVVVEKSVVETVVVEKEVVVEKPVVETVVVEKEVVVTQAPKPEQITLVIWSMMTQPTYRTWMEETIALFQETHPNVTVKEVVQSMDSLYPAFRASAKAGVGPDIISLFPGTWTMEEVWAGHVAPIGDYLTEEQLAHFFPAAVEANSFEGKMWSVPYNAGAMGLGYNKDLFAQAGLDPEAPPETWDEFMEASDKLQAAGVTPWGYGCSGDVGIGAFVGMWIPQGMDNNAEILVPVIGQASFVEEKYTGWIKYLDEAIERGVFNDDVTSLTYFEGMDLLPAGEVAMAVCHYTNVFRYNEAEGRDKYGWMFMPAFGKGKGAGTSDLNTSTFVIAEYSPHKELAAEFVAFMLLDPDRVRTCYEQSATLPATDLLGRDDIENLHIKRVLQLLQEHPGSMWFQDYLPIEIDKEGTGWVIDKIFAREITPEEGAQYIEDYAVKWRETHPDMVEKLSKWAAGVGLSQ